MWFSYTEMINIAQHWLCPPGSTNVYFLCAYAKTKSLSYSVQLVDSKFKYTKVYNLSTSTKMVVLAYQS